MFLRSGSTFNDKKNKKRFQTVETLQPHLIKPLIEKRKPEKIFRIYSSVKGLQFKKEKILQSDFVKNLHSSQPFSNIPSQSMFQTLNEFKKNVRKEKLNRQKFQKRFMFFSLKKTKATLTQLNRTSGLLSNSFISSKKSNKYEKKVLNNMNVGNNMLKKISHLTFLKKSDFSKDENDLKRFEKKRTLQKKRRLKKLKLENRRRKKRKRFYPRPGYLRFQLYSKFLKNRHKLHFSSKNKNLLDNQDSSQDSLKRQSLNQSFLTNSVFESTVPFSKFKNKIYRQKKQQWGNFSANLLNLEKSSIQKMYLILSTPNYHQQEFYKISNETLTEFERLCWKSYWLRSNLKPYIHKVQTLLKTMQKVESFKESKNSILFVLKDLSQNLFKSSLATLKVPYSTMAKKQNSIALGYLNIPQTLNSSFLENAEINSFKKFENKMQYDKFLYERITDEIKNVKNQLNVDGQNKARSYKPGRQKLEKGPITNNFDSIASFQNNFLEPNFAPFSFLSLTSNSAIKPFGDLPTLRILWALNKTNLFAYKENNIAKNLWTTYKNREQTKNNKTRKFISKISKFYSLNSKTIETISQKKTKHVDQKLQIFGSFNIQKNSHYYLRQLKLNLQTNLVFKKNLIAEKIDLQSALSGDNNVGKRFKNLKISNLERKTWFENNLENKVQKRMIHFWWSTKQMSLNESAFPIFLSVPFDFSNLEIYLNENRNFILKENHPLKTDILDKFQFLTFSDQKPFSFPMDKVIIGASFWICCCLFHISIFFSIIRIPEIRSLLKFQFLILSKLTNAYLIGIFSIYDLIKSYTTKVKVVMKKLSFVSVQKSAAKVTFNSEKRNQSFRVFEKNKTINSHFRFEKAKEFK